MTSDRATPSSGAAPRRVGGAIQSMGGDSSLPNRRVPCSGGADSGQQLWEAGSAGHEAAPGQAQALAGSAGGAIAAEHGSAGRSRPTALQGTCLVLEHGQLGAARHCRHGVQRLEGKPPVGSLAYSERTKRRRCGGEQGGWGFRQASPVARRAVGTLCGPWNFTPQPLTRQHDGIRPLPHCDGNVADLRPAQKSDRHRCQEQQASIHRIDSGIVQAGQRCAAPPHALRSPRGRGVLDHRFQHVGRHDHRLAPPPAALHDPGLPIRHLRGARRARQGEGQRWRLRHAQVQPRR